MFERTYYAPSEMMEACSNEELRERISRGLFARAVRPQLHQADRFVIGASRGGCDVRLPKQRAASAAGSRLRRRELRSVMSRDGRHRHTVTARRSRSKTWIASSPNGAREVIFSGQGRAVTWRPAPPISLPDPQVRSTRPWLERGSSRIDREDHFQIVIPGVCDSAQLAWG